MAENLRSDLSYQFSSSILNKTLPLLVRISLLFIDKQTDVNNFYTPTWNELYQIIGVHKRQHFKIQNLQKANLFLKSKLKELESPDTFAQDQGQSEGDY